MNTRRRVVCAASALVCSFMVCASSAWGVYSRDVTQQDFAEGIMQGMFYSSADGGLLLNGSTGCVPYLWVPSPNENVVSKIDARTGQELARYRIGPAGEDWEPCSVAADPEGNAYIACRCTGSTGKVVRIQAASSATSYGQPTENTSGDYDGNHQISNTEVLAWGQDDRVTLLLEVGPVNSMPSSIIMDRNGNAWVTLWGDGSIAKIDTPSGTVVAQIPLMGRPSNAVADGVNNVWVVSNEAKTLCQVNSGLNTLVGWNDLGNCEPGGMCLDSTGRIWIADRSDGLISFQTATGEFGRAETEDGIGFSSVTMGNNGDVWAASPDSNELVRFSGQDGTELSATAIGGSPTCLCTDGDGYIWSLSEQTDSAARIDASDGSQVLTASTCAQPFSATPFASCVTQEGVCPDGSWQMIVDSQLVGAGWGLISWNALDPSGHVRVEARTAEDTADLDSQPFQSVENGVRFAAPNGRYLEVRVRMRSGGEVSPILQSMHIEGTNLPPDVSHAVPSVDRILANDHSMQFVEITGVTDPEGDDFAIQVTGVTQDEPVSGMSEDGPAPDAVISDQGVYLRAQYRRGHAG